MIEEGAARDRGGISREDDGREEAGEGCVDDDKRDSARSDEGRDETRAKTDSNRV